jgi:hypothetical protein
MAFPLNKSTRYSLSVALTGTLTDLECRNIVSSVEEKAKFVAAAACAWNLNATPSKATVDAWRTSLSHASVATWTAIINHTRFPQCRTGIPFLEAGNRLTDFGFPQTCHVSVLECFLRRLRPGFTPDDLSKSALAQVLALTCS